MARAKAVVQSVFEAYGVDGIITQLRNVCIQRAAGGAGALAYCGQATQAYLAVRDCVTLEDLIAPSAEPAWVCGRRRAYPAARSDFAAQQRYLAPKPARASVAVSSTKN